MTHFRQCVLTRPTERGESRLTTWIEERFAVEGLRVSLKDDPDQHIYTVADVGTLRRTQDEVREFQRSFDRWRRHTDR